MPGAGEIRSRCRHGRKSRLAISKRKTTRLEELQAMTNTEQERWARVKGRLRSTVGEDVYTSWFARMDLEAVQDESVHLSVPTRFLKSWIQAHYAERVRSAMSCAAPTREIAQTLEARRVERVELRAPIELRSAATAPVSASHDALG